MMDSMKQADIVISTAGREKGKLFMVLKADGQQVLLIDGKYRKTENPKRKNTKHVRFVSHPETDLTHRVCSGARFENHEIRKALAALETAQTPAYEV